MFNISRKNVDDYDAAFNMHRYFINRMNIFSLNISLINGKHRHLDFQTYNICFRNALSDIELKSDPIETIVPYADEETDGFKCDRKFYLNYETEEAKTIVERIDADVMKDTLIPGSDLAVKFANNEISLADLVDDVYLYFIVTKYCEQIDLIRLQDFSNASKLIEYTVEFVTPKVLKNYINTEKVNIDKYSNKCKDLIFNPTFAKTVRYFTDDNLFEKEGIKPFNLQELMMVLATNYTVKSDSYIILGILLAIEFGYIELNKPDKDKDKLSPCVEFIKRISNEFINV